MQEQIEAKNKKTENIIFGIYVLILFFGPLMYSLGEAYDLYAFTILMKTVNILGYSTFPAYSFFLYRKKIIIWNHYLVSPYICPVSVEILTQPFRFFAKYRYLLYFLLVVLMMITYGRPNRFSKMYCTADWFFLLICLISDILLYFIISSKIRTTTMEIDEEIIEGWKTVNKILLFAYPIAILVLCCYSWVVWDIWKYS